MATAKNPAAINAANCPAFIGPRSLPGPSGNRCGRPYRLRARRWPRGGVSAISAGRLLLAVLACCAVEHRPDPLDPIRVPGFRTVPGWLVVLPPGRRLRQVALPDDTSGKVVRIQVALAVTQPGRAPSSEERRVGKEGRPRATR